MDLVILIFILSYVNYFKKLVFLKGLLNVYEDRIW